MLLPLLPEAAASRVAAAGVQRGGEVGIAEGSGLQQPRGPQALRQSLPILQRKIPPG